MVECGEGQTEYKHYTMKRVRIGVEYLARRSVSVEVAKTRYWVVGTKEDVRVIFIKAYPKKEDGYTWSTGPFDDEIKAKAYRNAICCLY